MTYATGLPMEKYDLEVIKEYEAQLADDRAVRQAKRQPLMQALKVFKWLYGYEGKSTMQHNAELCKMWERIKNRVQRHYWLFDIREADPEKLAEMNIYAIRLVLQEHFTDVEQTFEKRTRSLMEPKN